MIQIHLWIPCLINFSTWQQKLNSCIEEIYSNFRHIEIGPIQIHVRRQVLDINLFATVLEELLFIPLCHQLHCVFLIEQDIIPLDHFRLIDDLIHLDSLSRTSKRAYVLVLDLINASARPKLPLSTVKSGIVNITKIPNSRTYSIEMSQESHPYSVENCDNCTLVLCSSLSSIFYNFTQDLTQQETCLQNHDTRPHLAPPTTRPS